VRRKVDGEEKDESGRRGVIYIYPNAGFVRSCIHMRCTRQTNEVRHDVRYGRNSHYEDSWKRSNQEVCILYFPVCTVYSFNTRGMQEKGTLMMHVACEHSKHTRLQALPS
jgi:hypothetical protein